MFRNKILKVVNVLLLILIINQWVGATVYPKLSGDWFEWGHERAGILLGIVSLVHLGLNWNWIKITYFKKSKKKAEA